MFQKSEAGTDSSMPKRVKIFVGGFESNEDYIYVRGRGKLPSNVNQILHNDIIIMSLYILSDIFKK